MTINTVRGAQAIINGRAILLTGSGAHMSAVGMDEKPLYSVTLSESGDRQGSSNDDKNDYEHDKE